MKWLKVLAVLAVLIIGLSWYLQSGRQPQPFAPDSAAALWLEPGPLAVHQHDEEFIDSSRPTSANGDFEGAPSRTLTATVWHPANAAAGPYPLVVYSHGFTSSRLGGTYLARALASLGYVVVAADYPLTNINAPGGPNVMDVVNQPGDVSFLIDSLIAQGNTSGHRLEGMVDVERVGLMGISLGGMTSTLASFHPEMGDDRVKAAISIAGPTAQFTEAFFQHRQVPFLMLAGDIDALVPYPSNAAPVPHRVPGSQLVTVTGASHTGFAGPAAALRWMHNPDAVGCWAVTRNFDGDAADEPWYDRLGTSEMGINYEAKNELCLVDPLPEAMNVLRQHMITAVVISSFFESQFALDASRRLAAARFLSQELPAEASEVSWTAAP
jgi:predicted dienelactone hydrolase